MIYMIKAIETRYNGYKFRSRLEARWAVFFDALDLKYKYEPEGYELRDGSYYLPDFWIPLENHEYEGAGYFVEIKPTKMSKEEEKKCEMLAIDSGHMVCALLGAPWPKEFNILKWMRNTGELNPMTVYQIINDHKYDTNLHEKGFIVYPVFAALIDADKPTAPEEFMYAYEKARSARFEHGERG